MRGRAARARPTRDLRRRNAHAALVALVGCCATGARRGGFAGALDAVRRRAEAGVRGAHPPQAALRAAWCSARTSSSAKRSARSSSGPGWRTSSRPAARTSPCSGARPAACSPFGVPAPRGWGALGLIALYVPLAGAGPSIQRAGVMGIAGLVAAWPAGGRSAVRAAARGRGHAALNPRAARSWGGSCRLRRLSAWWSARRVEGRSSGGTPALVAEAAAITIAATIGTAPLMAVHFQQGRRRRCPRSCSRRPRSADHVARGAGVRRGPGGGAAGHAVHGVEGAAAGLRAAGRPRRCDTVVGGRVARSPVAIVAGWLVVAAACAGLGRWRRSYGGAASRVARGSDGPLVRWWLAVRPAGRASRWHRGHRRRAAAGTRGTRDLVPRHRPGRRDADQLDGAAVLVDTGPPDGPILKRLKESGIKRLDALMLTHAEGDHEGAAAAVIRVYAPRLVVDGGAGWVRRSSGAARRSRRTASEHHAAAGETITLGGLVRVRAAGAATARERQPERQRARHPPGGRPLDAAHRRRRERRLAPLAPEPVDVLKVSHHGSADPGLPALLTQLAADRGDRSRPRKHLRAPGAVDARGAKRSYRRCADRSGRNRPPSRRRPDVGRAVSPQADTTPAGACAPRRGHGTVTPPSGAPVRLCAVFRIPRGKDSYVVKSRSSRARVRSGRGWRVAAPAAQAATAVVISQVAFRGPAGGNDELIQIRNVSGAARGHRRLVATGAPTATAPAKGARDHPRGDEPSGRQDIPVRQRRRAPDDRAPATCSTTRGSRHRRRPVPQRRRRGDRRRRLHGARRPPTARAPGCRPGRRGGATTVHPQGFGTQDTDDNAADFTGPQVLAPTNCGTACTAGGPDRAPRADGIDGDHQHPDARRERGVQRQDGHVRGIVTGVETSTARTSRTSSWRLGHLGAEATRTRESDDVERMFVAGIRRDRPTRPP